MEAATSVDASAHRSPGAPTSCPRRRANAGNADTELDARLPSRPPAAPRGDAVMAVGERFAGRDCNPLPVATVSIA